MNQQDYASCLNEAARLFEMQLQAQNAALIYGGMFNPHFGAQNAHKTPRQTKLEAAKAYLKERAAAHPEWKVEKASPTKDQLLNIDRTANPWWRNAT